MSELNCGCGCEDTARYNNCGCGSNNNSCLWIIPCRNPLIIEYFPSFRHIYLQRSRLRRR